MAYTFDGYKILILLFLNISLTLLYSGDWGTVTINTSKHQIKAKTPGNTHAIIFDACIFIPVADSSGKTFYYYIKEDSLGFKSLTTLLFYKYSNQDTVSFSWAGTTETSNSKLFRKIVLIN